MKVWMLLLLWLLSVAAIGLGVWYIGQCLKEGL